MTLSDLYQRNKRLEKDLQNLQNLQKTCKRLAKLAKDLQNLQNLQQVLQVVNLLNINKINLKLAKLAKLASVFKTFTCVRAHTHMRIREKIIFFFASFASFVYKLLIFNLLIDLQKFFHFCKFYFL